MMISSRTPVQRGWQRVKKRGSFEFWTHKMYSVGLWCKQNKKRKCLVDSVTPMFPALPLIPPSLVCLPHITVKPVPGKIGVWKSNRLSETFDKLTHLPHSSSDYNFFCHQCAAFSVLGSGKRYFWVTLFHSSAPPIDLLTDWIDWLIDWLMIS